MNVYNEIIRSLGNISVKVSEHVSELDLNLQRDIPLLLKQEVEGICDNYRE